MTGVRGPIPGARFGVALAVRTLPRRADRQRFSAEYMAELYGQPPGAQIRQVTGFLSQAFALRAALGAAPSPLEGSAMPTTSVPHRFRCRVLRHHHYRVYSTGDGNRYRACAFCGHESPGIRGPIVPFGMG
jgi:hypothetical protein